MHPLPLEPGPLTHSPTPAGLAISINKHTHVGHGVRLVEDDDLVGWQARATQRRLLADGDGGKGLDLAADHRDAALVRCVQLQHPVLQLLGAKQLPHDGQRARRLAGAGGAVEEQVRQLWARDADKGAVRVRS